VERLSAWVVRHRWKAMAAWLAITVVGIVVAPTVSSRLVSGVHVNAPAYTADAQIAARYGGATSDPGVLILGLPAPTRRS